MKRKILFITLFALNLTFIGCGKEETPVMSNSVETEITIEDEVITEEIEEPTENIIDEENVTEEIIEEIETTTEISEGVPFEEGEYSEPSVQENQNLSEYEQRMQRFNDDMKKLYEAGIITEQEYIDAIEYEPDIPLPGSTEYIPSTSDEAFAQQYEENAKKAREDDSSSLPLSDERTDINYDIDLPDEYKGR